MSALGTPVLINPNRAYWISSISADPQHNTVTANAAFFSTLSVSDVAQISTLQASSFQLTDDLNASTIFTSSLFANYGKFSTIQWDSDLSGGTGSVIITSDPSGVVVSGDPIRFDNLVYLTSTINIVQVSTLVDTDIFAQRGFISSISGLNISTNTATFRLADISTLLNNTILTNDISGYTAYFSTLSSGSVSANTVSFNQANISSLYVSSLEGVDISGADPDTWANYPAISTILANNNLITGISTLVFQDASRLYSLTGNNLFYNGQPIQYGASSNVSQWAQYPAVRDVNMQNSSITNANFMTASNLTLLGSNITSGNTFTNSLGVGGTSLVSLATIDSGGDLTCRNIDVGDTITGLADVNIYGSNALAGDNALYVVGGTTLTGGTTAGVPVHGTEIGALPVAGIDTVRIDVLPVGMGLNSATYIQLAAAAAGSFAAGGALSLAGGSYIELNSDEVRCINTTSGNKNTTLTVGNILSPPDIAATSSLTIQNIAGGGIQLQAGGQGSITGFSTIMASNLSSINIDLSTINGIDWQDISGGVFTTVSTFNNLFTSSLAVSSIAGVGFAPNQNTRIVGNGLIFQGSPNYISSLQNILSPQQNLNIFASTVDITANQAGTNGYVRLGSGGAFDTFIVPVGGVPTISSYQVIAKSTIVQDLTVSTIRAVGGLPIGVGSVLQYITPGAIDNLDTINLNAPNIQQLNIGASTINLNAQNTTTQSFSTIRQTVSSLAFSTATSVGSNTAFNYPLIIDYDTAGNTTVNSGVAIAVQGHNFAGGAVVNRVEMGARGNGENYIMSLWPGQNLEDLFIDATQVTIRDSDGFSTVINQDPYGIRTNGSLEVGLGGTVVTTNSITTSSFFISSINNFNAQATFANVIQLSSMRLYQSNSTLCSWDIISPSQFVTAAGYDIVLQQNGTYKIGASRQYNNTSGSDTVEYYFMKNGVPIEYTNSKTQIVNNSELIAYSEIVDTFLNGDIIQLGQYTTSADIYLSTFPGAYVSSPAVIATIYKVDM